MATRLLRAEEVALMVGVSLQTLNNWYRFKKENPNNKYARMIPAFQQLAPRSTRMWKEKDVYKLIKFRQSIPQGRYGVMGNITQKYVKKKGAENANTE